MPIRCIAVTGATGFIGGAIAASLQLGGYRLRVLVRPRSSRKTLPPGVERVVGELDDPTSIEQLFLGADAVVHCAGAVRGAFESTFTHTNVDAVDLLVRSAVRGKQIERFLLVSSLAATRPQVSPYAASKLEGETALQRGANAMTWLALRAPAVYGPGDRELLPLFKMMSRGLVPIWGARDSRFSLLFVTDLVAAIKQWLGSPTPASGIYELDDGHPEGYSMDEVIGFAETHLRRRVHRVRVPSGMLDFVAAANLRLARIVGYEPMLTPWKLSELRYPRWVCDNKDFTAASGWQPRISFDEGLRLALAHGREIE